MSTERAALLAAQAKGEAKNDGDAKKDDEKTAVVVDLEAATKVTEDRLWSSVYIEGVWRYRPGCSRLE